jgi:hypothetical protein
MALTTHDLNAFHQFAEAALANRGVETLHELVELWELEHPVPTLHSENVTAVRAAIRDMENGDTGRPARMVLDEMRAELAGRVSVTLSQPRSGAIA